MPVPILLDCDPGHDDAIAIAVAARYGRLIGITTVAGNVSLGRTTRNALVIRELFGLDVPIHSGAPRPLLAAAAPTAVHGETGLDGAEFPAPTAALDGTDAVAFIIESARATDGLWLVGIGPLTNIALALRCAPEIADRIAGIAVMGGGTFGNMTAVAEFNIHQDPEAAAIVFDYGGPLVLAGLDVTHRFLVTPERLATIDGPLAGTLGFYSAGYRERHEPGALAGAPLHDPLAVLALTHPDLFRRARRHVAVETTGTLTRGMTVIDQRTARDRPPANCDVLLDVDSDAAWALVAAAL